MGRARGRGDALPVIWLVHRLWSVVVTAEPACLRVRNVFQTREIPWTEIREVEFRSYGPCELRLLDGSSLGLFALQQANWRNMTSRPRRSLVAAIQYLNERAAAERAVAGVPTGYPMLAESGPTPAVS